MADYQRRRLYDFEHRHFPMRGQHDVALSPAEAVDLVAQVWRRYGVGAPPRVRFVPEAVTVGGRACAQWIKLYCKRQGEVRPVSKLLVLHEVAHSLVASCSRSDQHGPRFAGVLLGLVRRYAPSVDVAAALRANRAEPKRRKVDVDRKWTPARVRREAKALYARNVRMGYSRNSHYDRAVADARRAPAVEGVRLPKPERAKGVTQSQQRHAAGLCSECGAEDERTTAGKWLCAGCAQKQKERTAKRKAAAAAASASTRCGECKAAPAAARVMFGGRPLEVCVKCYLALGKPLVIARYGVSE